MFHKFEPPTSKLENLNFPNWNPQGKNLCFFGGGGRLSFPVGNNQPAKPTEPSSLRSDDKGGGDAIESRGASPEVGELQERSGQDGGKGTYPVGWAGGIRRW